MDKITLWLENTHFLLQTYLLPYLRNYDISIIIVLFGILILLVYLILTKNISSKRYAIKALHRTVKDNNVIESIRLIEKYPYAINISLDKTGYTPFLRACLSGNTLLVKYMLSKGANVHQTTSRKETCFYLAVYNRIVDKSSMDASCIHALYHAGADLNAPNDKGYTPLQMAALFGHTSVVKWLLAKGASMRGFPDPFELAKLQGHWHTAAVLKDKRVPQITFLQYL